MTREGVGNMAASLAQGTKKCESLAEVRAEIDRLDRAIVTLLAERGGYVLQAARFKRDAAAVHAPDRVEQVVAGVRALAGELGADADVVEQGYRALIRAYTEAELREHAALGDKARP